MKLFTFSFFGRMRWIDEQAPSWHTLEVYASNAYQAKMSILVDYRDVSQITELRRAA